jgi:hypothetical protein
MELRISETPRPERRTELLLLGCRHRSFCKIFSSSDAGRSSQFQLETHQDIRDSLTPIGFNFGYSTRVSKACLVVGVRSFSQCDIVSFALWEQKKVVIAIGSTLWLANATSYVYSLYLSSYKKWSF